MTWRKLWLLFTVIWVVITALQAVTIVAVGEEPAEKAARPLVLLFVVPAVLYLLGLGWQWLRRRKPSGS